ncbi:unnamed protein product [Cylindrotheca closterium]|uniref:EF-hand domain-containing protein n=1 Tax=Cylindrotheca closterium TaxID=2856 RepID=A0AAD2C9W6_9STRA|nr:unnamed protein product [Cylindrotheca closterium]
MNSQTAVILRTVAVMLMHAISCANAFSIMPTSFHWGGGLASLLRARNMEATALIKPSRVMIRRMTSVEDDEEDEDELAEDPYEALAASEFLDTTSNETATEAYASSITRRNADLSETKLDWGGAIGKLRQRVEDVESGLSKQPSQALFRIMSEKQPNMLIGEFVQSADPKTVQAMSGAVGSLLGGLATPSSGIETVVKASGDKIGSLCFQLQMTGYMFRNAEYVLALKDVLNLQGKRSLKDYKDAFDKLDKDNSGFIEVTEIVSLFEKVYEGDAPAYETEAFMNYFDQNNDGRISWGEFEKGLGAAFVIQPEEKVAGSRLLSGQSDDLDDDDDEDEDEMIDISTDVSGTIDIELENGMIVEVDAKEYMEALQDEAEILKAELSLAKGEIPKDLMGGILSPGAESMDITQFIAAHDGDVSTLTDGISPEVVDTMKKLVKFVLEGGESGKGKKKPSNKEKSEMQMVIPGNALQQLSLWQLVLGYRLREAEAIGDYKKLLRD